MLFKHLGLLGKGNNISREFTPPDIGNMQLWLDSSDLSTITKDVSDYVSTWVDKSVNSYSFNQATGTKQAKYNDTLKSLDFDAGDEYELPSGSNDNLKWGSGDGSVGCWFTVTGTAQREGS